jgi:hypothetical protein
MLVMQGLQQGTSPVCHQAARPTAAAPRRLRAWSRDCRSVSCIALQEAPADDGQLRQAARAQLKQAEEQLWLKYPRMPCASPCLASDHKCLGLEGAFQHVLNYPRLPNRIAWFLPSLKATLPGMVSVIEGLTQQFGQELTLHLLRKEPYILTEEIDVMVGPTRCPSLFVAPLSSVGACLQLACGCTSGRNPSTGAAPWPCLPADGPCRVLAGHVRLAPHPAAYGGSRPWLHAMPAASAKCLTCACA